MIALLLDPTERHTVDQSGVKAGRSIVTASLSLTCQTSIPKLKSG
jgi:hypothetical protein